MKLSLYWLLVVLVACFGFILGLEVERVQHLEKRVHKLEVQNQSDDDPVCIPTWTN